MSLPDRATTRVAIVDYGLGNLFSVQRACETVGADATVTSSPADVRSADAVILPGVGAFGDAMAALRAHRLDAAIVRTVEDGKPLMGVCLGMQLLMTESAEFGRHAGLDLIPGDVVRLSDAPVDGRRVKIPQVGWNRLRATQPWDGSPLAGQPDALFMYFVHSFYVRPADADCVVSVTRYGQTEFCSSLRRGRVFACQFHPERSGPAGLDVYRRFIACAQPDLEVSHVRHQ